MRSKSIIAKMLLPTTLLQGGAEAHVGNAQRLQRRPSKKARLSRVCGTVMSEKAWQSGEERGQLTCGEERAWLTTSQERTPRQSGLGNSAVMGGRGKQRPGADIRHPGGLQQEGRLRLSDLFLQRTQGNL